MSWWEKPLGRLHGEHALKMEALAKKTQHPLCASPNLRNDWYPDPLEEKSGPWTPRNPGKIGECAILIVPRRTRGPKKIGVQWRVFREWWTWSDSSTCEGAIHRLLVCLWGQSRQHGLMQAKNQLHHGCSLSKFQPENNPEKLRRMMPTIILTYENSQGIPRTILERPIGRKDMEILTAWREQS